MTDWIRSLLFPLLIFVIVASLWIYAKAESLHFPDGAAIMLPADPELVERAWGPAAHDSLDSVNTIASIPLVD